MVLVTLHGPPVAVPLPLEMELQGIENDAMAPAVVMAIAAAATTGDLDLLVRWFMDELLSGDLCEAARVYGVIWTAKTFDALTFGTGFTT